MQMAGVLLSQTIVMFMLCGVGYLLFKAGKITSEGSLSLGNILIYVVLPCVIINSFYVERTKEKVISLAISALVAAIVLFLSIVVSRLFFKKDAIATFASSFSNPGFFGIPLIVSALSNGAVFYIAAFIAFLNLLQFTYGVSIMKGGKAGVSLKKIIRAPFMTAILIGLIIFFFQLPLPMLVTRTLGIITGINTPLAMFTVGVYLARTSLLDIFRKKKLYAISLVRLVIIPIITLFILSIIPNIYLELKMALLIVAACPVGSNVAVYAQLNHQDYGYAVETVILSTMLSIITIPCMAILAQLLW